MRMRMTIKLWGFAIASILLCSPAFSQPTLTSIQDVLYRPDGSNVRFNGRLVISWQTFVQNGARVAAGTRTYRVNNGVVNLQLVPNDTATPANTTYRVLYDLDFGTDREVSWTVPTSGSPVTISTIEGPPASTIVAPAGIISLNGLTSATQTFADVDDANVTLSWGSASSTHTLTAGWTGQLAVSRGGTGAASLTGVLRGNGTSAFSAASASDIVGLWSMCVSGFLKYDGTCETPPGGVSSVFSRTGAVVADNGDYTASQVTNVAAGGISAVTVQAAIDELDTEKQAADTDLTTIAGLSCSDGQIIKRATGAWACGTDNTGGGGGDVSSVFSRTGAVTAQSGDYNAGQITNTPAGAIAASDVQAALNELDTEKLALAGGTMTGQLTLVPSSGTYALDVQKSGSAGTARIYDQTVTTGVTQLFVRAGAGQNQALTAWQDNAGDAITSVLANGAVWRLSAGAVKVALDTDVELHSGGRIRFFNDPNIFGATADAGVSRSAAGMLEVNNGTAGTFRDLKLRSLIVTDQTEPTCDSTTRGVVVMDQGGSGVADTFRVCRKDAADAYAWVPLM